MKKKCLLFIFLLASFSASAKSWRLSATINGAQEVPATGSSATGSMTGSYNDVTNQITYTVIYSGLADITASHFHGNANVGVNAGVKIGIGALPSPIVGTATVDEADETALLTGLWYVNIHTTAFGGGEIRGQVTALPVRYYSLAATINGSQEVPATGSTATGAMVGLYDDETNQLSYTITYAGVADIIASHFHGNADIGVNAGVKIGIGALPSPLIGSATVSAADETALLGGLWYFNLHTTAFSGGEIRGQVLVTGISLSLDLIRFTAAPNNEAIQLDWQTANERRNKGFEVLHSRDAINWENLGFVESQGEKGKYNFQHKDPIGNAHYYRLAQMDVDGKISFSKTIAVIMNQKGIVKIFPSLTNNNLTIVGETASEYGIFDLFGHQILRGYLRDNQQVVDVSALPSGMYMIKTKQATVKFLKH